MRKPIFFLLVLMGRMLPLTATPDHQTNVQTTTKALFLVAGQSNAVGQGKADESPDCSGLPCFEYDASKDTVVSLKDPFGHAWKLFQPAGTGSVAPAFAKRYHELSGKEVVMISAARGGASCHLNARMDDYDCWDESGNLFPLAVGKICMAINKTDAPLSGILWMQGERDANAIVNGELTPAEYKKSLKDLIFRFKKEYGAELPFYIVLTGFQKDRDRSGVLAVRGMQKEVASEIKGAHVIYSETDLFLQKEWYKDHVHYNQTALNHIGTTVAERIAATEMQKKEHGSLIGQRMIWIPEFTPGKQAHVVFTKKFNIQETPDQTIIDIFADSRYILWVNGRYVMRGPCRFNPVSPEYDVADITRYLKKGDNRISVLVHNYGDKTNGRIMRNTPGLGVVLSRNGQVLLTTDSTWRYHDVVRYLPVGESWSSIPDYVDARIDDEPWTKNDFDDTTWRQASGISGTHWGEFNARRMPMLTEQVVTTCRTMPDGTPLARKFPITLQQGENIILDLGEMAMVYPEIWVEAPENSKFTLGYALRFKEDKPQESFGGESIFITRNGKQHFMGTDQWGCRYVTLTCKEGSMRIDSLKMTDRRYPFIRKGSFTCNNPILNEVWKMGVKTVEVTCDDAYGSDVRERNEWVQDASKPSFHTTRVSLSSLKNGKTDTGLLRSMLRHAAQAQLADGSLTGTFPTDRGARDCHYIIEDYACQFMEALEYDYDVTGDEEFVTELWPVVERQMNLFINRITPDGLLYAREFTSFDNPLAYITCQGATLNAYFYGALKASAKLAGILKQTDRAAYYDRIAAALYEGYQQVLWNEQEKAYNAGVDGDQLYLPSVHAQSLALYYGLVPQDKQATVMEWFLRYYKNPGAKQVVNNTKSHEMLRAHCGIEMPIEFFWVLGAFYKQDVEALDREAIHEVARRWHNMVSLQQDAGTLSESFVDHEGKGSHESCHNYGATPVYYLSSYVLGVRTEGSFAAKKLIIEPRLGDLQHASGEVITDFGPVKVDWRYAENGTKLSFEINLPEGVTAELRLPASRETKKLILNKKRVSLSSEHNGLLRKGRWLSLPEISGTQQGTLSYK